MLSKNLQRKNFIKLALACVASVSLLLGSNYAFAAPTCETNTSNLYQCSDDQIFRVNVNEFLSVSVTLPSTMASGDTNDFLRNKISVDVASNNAYGFVASMYSKTTTDLTNSAASTNNTIPTLSSASTQASFPANYWGYSLDDISTSISGTASYNAMRLSGNPITLISSADSLTTGGGHKDVAFGAKADSTKTAGTYSNTVVISVVSGNITEDNPVIPVNPATPSDQPNPNYDGSYTDPSTNTVVGRTSYTTTTTNASAGTTTTTTEITTGDNTGSYASPQGVTNTTASTTTRNINEGTPLATGLAVTAGVAATAGVIFFILAKRKDDDDEEEQ